MIGEQIKSFGRKFDKMKKKGIINCKHHAYFLDNIFLGNYKDYRSNLFQWRSDENNFHPSHFPAFLCVVVDDPVNRENPRDRDGDVASSRQVSP